MKRLVGAAACAILFAPFQAAAQQPIVTDIVWPQIDSYCTFTRADQTFDYNNPDSWRFVYFTQFDTIMGTNAQTGFISVHHQLRQMETLKAEIGDDAQSFAYRTYGKPTYEVKVELKAGELGFESTGFSGTLTVEGADGTETIDIKGDCGV